MERKSRKYKPRFKPRPSKTDRQINADLEEEKRRERPPRAVDQEKARERTVQRAVKLLAAKPRSVEELRERLLEKQWTDAAAVEYALAKLKEYGYLDDDRFAFGFASYRVRQKPVGRQRLARDLPTPRSNSSTGRRPKKSSSHAPSRSAYDCAEDPRRVRRRRASTTTSNASASPTTSSSAKSAKPPTLRPMMKRTGAKPEALVRPVSPAQRPHAKLAHKEITSAIHAVEGQPLLTTDY